MRMFTAAKNAMFVAIVGVGISTAAFGLLPTIAQAGFIAPVLFLILRLIQGIFVGGVVASTHTIGTEWAPHQLAWRNGRAWSAAAAPASEATAGIVRVPW